VNIDLAANEMVAEHAAGVGYRGIGARHGLSHEGARRVVMSQGTNLVAHHDPPSVAGRRGEPPTHRPPGAAAQSAQLQHHPHR
jgi:hypothetical protein